MKRDLPSSASPWRTTPAVGMSTVVRYRAPRAHLATALVLLLPRELTRTALANALHRRFPNDPVNIQDIVHRLLAAGQIMEDPDGNIGLTETGSSAAEQLRREAAHPAAMRPILDEDARRAAVLEADQCPQLLTRSPPRQMGQSADLAVPPVRTGAEQHLRPPSRIGDLLHYRDGRITRLDGTEVQPARGGTDYYVSIEDLGGAGWIHRTGSSRGGLRSFLQAEQVAKTVWSAECAKASP